MDINDKIEKLKVLLSRYDEKDTDMIDLTESAELYLLLCVLLDQNQQ